MTALPTAIEPCPYCGELLELTWEPLAEVQDYVEDCHVCCAPISIRVRPAEEDPQGWKIEISRSDD